MTVKMEIVEEGRRRKERGGERRKGFLKGEEAKTSFHEMRLLKCRNKKSCIGYKLLH